MDFLDRHVASFLQALLTQRMLVDVPITDSFPSPAVPLAGRVAALELLVVLFHDLGVLLAVDTVSQVRASGIAARPLGFPWHGRRLLPCITKALQDRSLKASWIFAFRYCNTIMYGTVHCVAKCGKTCRLRSQSGAPASGHAAGRSRASGRQWCGRQRARCQSAPMSCYECTGTSRPCARRYPEPSR
ncbi:MAG: hypothetical protein ACFWUE_04195 [Xylanivirga thermophila]